MIKLIKLSLTVTLTKIFDSVSFCQLDISSRRHQDNLGHRRRRRQRQIVHILSCHGVKRSYFLHRAGELDIYKNISIFILFPALSKCEKMSK
jgi:hypothetical protein